MTSLNTAALLPLAESIADGSPIDWAAAEAGATDEERAVIRQLQILSRLAGLHRTLPIAADAAPDVVRSRHALAAPAIGSWAHLTLIERLGGGTFGDVYRAWDRHLEREVALKLLRGDEGIDDLRASIIANEGRLLARICHPNVITVHGVASHDNRVGLWMELVRGVTLEQQIAAHGPLSAREAAMVGIDLCRALAAIHAAGLIHRDVKAQNVMREDGGRIVLMDLGTGREVDRTGPQSVPDLAGTPLYLAPELLTGMAPASARTDLYSLGVLLYHLVTGAFPVKAATIQQLNEGHKQGRGVRLRDARANLPTAFVRVVDRAIASDPEQRYPTAGAFEAELAQAMDDATPTPVPVGRQAPKRRLGISMPRVGLLVAAIAALVAAATMGWPALRGRTGRPGTPATVRSIAVLPLLNVSGDPTQEYFADGMTDELISTLGKLDGVSVISRTSTMQFKGTKRTAPQIAKALNVDAVLEGSVRLLDGAGLSSGAGAKRVRINARLIHAGTDTQLWDRTFETVVSEALALQSEIARTVAAGIGARLRSASGESTTHAGGATGGRGQTVNPEAYEAYLRGRYYWNKRSDEGFQKALDFFRQAAALDPSFARAYAGQADVYNLLPGRMSPFTAYPLAKDAANHALELDPTLAEAHTSLAFATFIFDRDWAAAETGYKRALQFNPGYATAHHWYGEYLSAMGRLDEAVAQLKEAELIDPLSTSIRTSLASAFYMARRFDEAIERFRAIVDSDDGDPSAFIELTLAYALKGMFGEAEATLDRWSARLGATASQRALSAAVAAMKGDRAGAIRQANDLVARGRDIDNVSDLVSYAYIYLGQHDRALDLLARAERGRAPALLWAKVDPILDPVRHHARFRDLLRQLLLAP